MPGTWEEGTRDATGDEVGIIGMLQVLDVILSWGCLTLLKGNSVSGLGNPAILIRILEMKLARNVRTELQLTSGYLSKLRDLSWTIEASLPD